MDVEDHVRLAVDLDAEVALEITGGDHRAGLPRAARQPKARGGPVAPPGADRVGRSPWPTPQLTLLPTDDLMHENSGEENFNESAYYNFYDPRGCGSAASCGSATGRTRATPR